jgi:hypothetical protein
MTIGLISNWDVKAVRGERVKHEYRCQIYLYTVCEPLFVNEVNQQLVSYHSQGG